MVGSWGSGAIIGTAAPEIGHAFPQTVAVLTSDAGQSVPKDIIFSSANGACGDGASNGVLLGSQNRFRGAAGNPEAATSPSLAKRPAYFDYFDLENSLIVGRVA